MQTGLVHLHNILRWLILLFLLITLIQAFSKSAAVKKTSLFLLIVSHLTLVIGIYQLIAGRFGITKGFSGEGSWMSDKFYRFFWLEHPLLTLIAIVLITIARGKAKVLNYKATSWLLVIALVLLLAAIPWPFREIVGRPYFPGGQ
jgi:hypothetical protein